MGAAMEAGASMGTRPPNWQQCGRAGGQMKPQAPQLFGTTTLLQVPPQQRVKLGAAN